MYDKMRMVELSKIIRMLGGLRVGGFPLYDTLQCTMIILWVNAFVAYDKSILRNTAIVNPEKAHVFTRLV